MTRISGYHRPSTVADALTLLRQEVVDLQDLGLAGITRDGAVLRFGATVRLQQVVDHEWTPPALRDLAHGEAPSTLRNAATIGGTVAAADPESRLLAGLVAYEAEAVLAGPTGEEAVQIDALLADRTLLKWKLITSVAIDIGGTGASAGTARTPADTPIVLVAGRQQEDGTIRLAATGVAPTPVAISSDTIDSLQPPGDFRGTPEYRRHLARVLSARVLSELEEAAKT